MRGRRCCRIGISSSIIFGCGSSSGDGGGFSFSCGSSSGSKSLSHSLPGLLQRGCRQAQTYTHTHTHTHTHARARKMGRDTRDSMDVSFFIMNDYDTGVNKVQGDVRKARFLHGNSPKYCTGHVNYVNYPSPKDMFAQYMYTSP